MSQSFQPRTVNSELKNMPSLKTEPITKVPDPTVRFSQGVKVQPEENAEPNTNLSIPSEFVKELSIEKQFPNGIVEQSVPIATITDFIYGRSSSSSFCMRCGGHAQYYGKSIKQNFNKKLCGDCVNYYSLTLNV